MIEFKNPGARIPHWRCEKDQRWLLRAPTGWGKTVWLRQVALLRDAEASEVWWNGEKVTPARLASYRSQWLYLPQAGFRSPETIARHLDSVLALRTHANLVRAAFHEEFRDALKALGLERLDPDQRVLQDLSGGELQALSLVRAVLLRPEGLFFDEPTSAMDAALTLKMEDWVLRNHRGAWVWITHDGGQADRLLTKGARLLIPG